MTNTLQGRALRGLAAGCLSGLAAWLVIDNTGWFSRLLDNVGGIRVGSHVYWLQGIVGGLFGLLVGAGAAIADIDMVSRNLQKAKIVVQCALCGLVGGIAGMQIGDWAYNRIISPSDASSESPTAGRLLAGLIARSIGWALVGAAIGASQGLPRRSGRASRLGAVGGFMGGLAGGGVFEALELGTSNPNLARLAGFVFVGSAIGFFLEVVPVLLKQAWIRIEAGRGAGSEFMLEKRWTSVGRSETADIRLYGDPTIAPVHFLIESGPSLSLLRPSHGQDSDNGLAPIRIGDRQITADTALVGGEEIAFGSFRLRFSVRSSPAKIRRSRDADASPIQPPLRRPRSTSPRPPKAALESPPAAPLDPAQVGHVASSSRRIADDGLSGTRLRAIHGPYFEQTFALPARDEIVIGRGTVCDLPLSNDKAISRRHCAVRLTEGRHWIVDLKSANGTLLNDIRIVPSGAIRLRPGDCIKIGDTLLVYE